MHHQDSWALVSSFRVPGELSCKLCIAVAICNRLRVYDHVFLLRTICNRHRHPRSSFLSSCHESPLVIIPYQYSKIKARFPVLPVQPSGDAPDSPLPANRCSRHPKGHSDGGRIYRTYRPMNGQPMLPKWPTDASSHTFGRNRESRSCEAAGRRNYPEAVPEKCAQEKGWPTELGRSVRYRPRHVSR